MSNHFMSFFPILSLRFSNFHSVWVQPVIYPHVYIHVMMVYGSFFMADSGISGVFELLTHWSHIYPKEQTYFLWLLNAFFASQHLLICNFYQLCFTWYPLHNKVNKFKHYYLFLSRVKPPQNVGLCMSKLTGNLNSRLLMFSS